VKLLTWTNIVWLLIFALGVAFWLWAVFWVQPSLDLSFACQRLL